MLYSSLAAACAATGSLPLSRSPQARRRGPWDPRRQARAGVSPEATSDTVSRRVRSAMRRLWANSSAMCAAAVTRGWCACNISGRGLKKKRVLHLGTSIRVGVVEQPMHAQERLHSHNEYTRILWCSFSVHAVTRTSSLHADGNGMHACLVVEQPTRDGLPRGGSHGRRCASSCQHSLRVVGRQQRQERRQHPRWRRHRSRGLGGRDGQTCKQGGGHGVVGLPALAEQHLQQR